MSEDLNSSSDPLTQQPHETAEEAVSPITHNVIKNDSFEKPNLTRKNLKQVEEDPDVELGYY